MLNAREGKQIEKSIIKIDSKHGKQLNFTEMKKFSLQDEINTTFPFRCCQGGLSDVFSSCFCKEKLFTIVKNEGKVWSNRKSDKIVQIVGSDFDESAVISADEWVFSV